MRAELRTTPVKQAGSLPTSQCPVCSYEMDEATCVSHQGEGPSAGDLSVCLHCGEVLQFNDILVLKTISDEELAFLDDQTKATLAKAKSIIVKRGRIR